MQDELRRDLTAAMRLRDTVTVSALRSLLSALANAEAVDGDEVPPTASTASEHVAGASPGVASAEVERRRRSDGESDGVVRREVEERRQAAAQLAATGHEERAGRLLAEAELLSTYLHPRPGHIVPPVTGA